MITVRGAVPFPRTDAMAIRRLSADLRLLGTNLGGSAGQLAQTANSTQSAWSGRAADGFRNHMMKRSATVSSMGRSIARCAPVLDTFAAAIVTAETAYSIAATAEQVARAAIPFSSAALAAAIAAETAAVAGLQAAGVACGAALAIIELEILAAEFLGVSRESFNAVKTAAVQMWEDISEAIGEGDIDAAISALNTTVEIPNGSGGSTRYNPLGIAIDAVPWLDDVVEGTQAIVGIGVLLSSPPLETVARPDLVAELEAHGYVRNPSSATEVGRNMALLEQLQRERGVEVDQSMAMFHTRGTTSDGRQVLNLTIPGIVPPGEDSLYGESGARNLPNAAASQITGTGREEAAIREWVLTQDLEPGATVNIYGHSQGGIVGANVGDTLAGLGYDVNVVTFGSPDQQMHPGVEAYVVQNTRDAVPLARIGGDHDSVITLTERQRLIRFDHELAESRPAFDHHGAIEYGRWLDANVGDSTDTIALQGFISEQTHVRLDPNGTGVVVLEGPRTPAGDPVTVPQPYEVRP
ncbi:MAG: hypothetical protein AAFP84_11450 [Actinomycetota bacterium]